MKTEFNKAITESLVFYKLQLQRLSRPVRQIWQAFDGLLRRASGHTIDPAKPELAPPYWQECRRESQRREFFRMFQLLNDGQKHEMVEVLKFQLWRQHWLDHQRELPGFPVIRGALLAVTFPIRTMLVRWFL